MTGFLLHYFTCILAVNFMRKKRFETLDPHIRRIPTFGHEIRGKSCSIYALDYRNQKNKTQCFSVTVFTL